MSINDFVSESEIDMASVASSDLANELKGKAGKLGYDIFPSIVCEMKSRPRIVIEAYYTLLPEIKKERGPVVGQKLLTELVPQSRDYKGKIFLVELCILSDIPPSNYL